VAEYSEIHAPGAHVTYTAGTGGVTGGQAVELSAAMTVITASGTTGKAVVGIAMYDAPAGSKVTVARGGVQYPTAGGTVAFGARVKAAATGKVVAFTIGTDSHADCLGIALEAGTNGNPLRVAWEA
jgi:hypothetical protein